MDKDKDESTEKIGLPEICLELVLEEQRRKRNVAMNPGGYWYGYGYQQPQVGTLDYFLDWHIASVVWLIFTIVKAFLSPPKRTYLCRCLCARVGQRKCQAPLSLEPSMPTILPQLVSREEENGGLR